MVHLACNEKDWPIADRLLIPPGDTWTAAFLVLNAASTYWYHPHVHGKTSEQVYRGLTGVLIVKDARSGQLGLPDEYGVDDLPLIIQDRRFAVDASLLYMNQVQDRVGMKGDYILVNGRIGTTLTTHAQVIRFRILNGSNARFYMLGSGDKREFYQIGGDGELLEAPVAISRLQLAPAERAEILVDFTGDRGASVELVSYSEELEMLDQLRDAFDVTTFTVLSIEVGGADSGPGHHDPELTGHDRAPRGGAGCAHAAVCAGSRCANRNAYSRQNDGDGPGG